TTPMSFMSYTLAQSLVPTLRGNATYILVKLLPGADRDQVMAEIRRRLPFNDVHPREEWAAKTRSYWLKSTGIGINMIMTVFLGCVIGIVIVAQALYTFTIEHLREFGMIKAVGGSNRDVYAILARQAWLSAVTGFVLGYLPSRALEPAVEAVGMKML